MIFNIILGLITIYGLYFYIQGKQEMSKEVRQTWNPQDIDDWQTERDHQKYIGQVILCSVAIYFMFVLI